eukprot:1053345-Rhodomonas_salina.1
MVVVLASLVCLWPTSPSILSLDSKVCIWGCLGHQSSLPTPSRKLKLPKLKATRSDNKMLPMHSTGRMILSSLLLRLSMRIPVFRHKIKCWPEGTHDIAVDVAENFTHPGLLKPVRGGFLVENYESGFALHSFIHSSASFFCVMD